MQTGWLDIWRRNRQIRGPKNEFDRATIFSILPKEIKERKITLEAPDYCLEPGSPEKPTSLIVEPASWWREIDADQPLLEIPVSSVQIAESVVRDYSNGVIMCDMGERRPGLFFLPGRVSVDELKTKHKDILNLAIKRQENWFRALVKLADSFWARTNGNPMAISDDCRMAANMLKLMDRPWLLDYKLESVVLSACPACGTIRNNAFPVCANCKTVIDTDKFSKLGLKFAS
jgi:hypothetical protein